MRLVIYPPAEDPEPFSALGTRRFISYPGDSLILSGLLLSDRVIRDVEMPLFAKLKSKVRSKTSKAPEFNVARDSTPPRADGSRHSPATGNHHGGTINGTNDVSEQNFVPSQTSTQHYPVTAGTENKLTGGEGSLDMSKPNHALQSQTECWAQTLARLKEREPNTYAQLEQSHCFVTDTFVERLRNRMATYEDEKSVDSSTQWFARLKRSLPALATIKGLSMTIAKADPHQLAPYLCAGVFCAVELSLNMVSAEDQLIAMEIVSEISIILEKWLLKERHSRSVLFDATTEALGEELFQELLKLYERCLLLYHSIISHLDGLRVRKVLNKITQVDVKWKASFEAVKRSNKMCDATWSRIEFLTKVQKDDEAILDWISDKPCEMSHRQIMERTGVDERYHDRNLWFFHSQGFREWQQSLSDNPRKRVLWLRGPVGTGKTTTICQTLEKLLLDQSLENTTSTRISHFYCQVVVQASSRSEFIIRAILRQLALLSNSTLCNGVQEEYRRHKQSRTQNFNLSLTQWQEVFHSIMGSCSPGTKTVILIDALDECPGDEVDVLLRFLKDLVAKHYHVHLILTSQLHIQVHRYFSAEILAMVQTGTSEATKDMAYFIDTEIQARSMLPKNQDVSVFALSANEKLRQEFRHELVSKAHGMFQWVKIWLALMFPIEPIALQAEAENLLNMLKSPTTDPEDGEGLGSLNNAYLNLYLRVRHRPIDRKYKVRIYRIILGAREPLTAATVAAAATVEDDGNTTQTINEDYVREVCHNFFVENNGKMMVTHDSARIFLQAMSVCETAEKFRLDDFSPAASNAELARICARILMSSEHPIWKDGGLNPRSWVTTLSNIDKVKKEIEKQWAVYVNRSEHRSDRLAFLNGITDNLFATEEKENVFEWSDPAIRISGLALYVMIWWLDHWETAVTAIDNAILDESQIPIRDFVAKLDDLEHSALHGCWLLSDIYCTMSMISDFRPHLDKWRRCVSSSLRIEKGTHIFDVAFLVMTSRIFPDSYFSEYIAYMSTNKTKVLEVKCIQFLHDCCKVGFKSRNMNTRSILAVAVERGDCNLVKRILRLEKSHCLQNFMGMKVWKSELLLARDSNGDIPLHLAINVENTAEMVTTLLDSEADQIGRQFPDLSVKKGNQCGWLSRDACITNKWGKTVLHRAAEAGKFAVVSLLIQAGATEMRMDNDSYLDVVINAQDSNGRTPIASAMQHSPCKYLVDLLNLFSAVPTLAINLEDYDGNTPLHSLCARSGFWKPKYVQEAIPILLELDGIKAGLTNKKGETPIFLAADQGYNRIVELLCQRSDVNPDATDKAGRTPLWIAQYRELESKESKGESRSSQKWTSMVDILIATTRVNTEPVNGEGQSPQEALEAKIRETKIQEAKDREAKNLGYKIC